MKLSKAEINLVEYYQLNQWLNGMYIIMIYTYLRNVVNGKLIINYKK